MALESALSVLLKRNPETRICSVVPATTIEVWADLHKDNAHAFFSRRYFQNLLTGEKTLGVREAGTKIINEPLAVQCIRFVQKKRNQYLDVTATGGTNFIPFDGKDPLPKDIMRHFAIVSSLFEPVQQPGLEYDIQLGLDFISDRLFRFRESSELIEGMHNRLSVRRNARSAKREVTSPIDQVFLAEWIFDETSEALALKEYARETVPERTRHALLGRISEKLVEKGWRFEDLEMGKGCTKPSFNVELVTTVPLFELEILGKPWLPYEQNPDLLRFALAHARQNGEVFNAGKIWCASNFPCANPNVTIQRTDYFSSLMTDQLAWHRIRSKQLSKDGITAEHTLWDGISGFVDGSLSDANAQLKGLAEASISNQLGASTLAFSDDGHLMVVYQNARNVQSKHMLAPSGSGSLDWQDVGASKARDFLSLVRYGAERELREECALEGYDDQDGHKPEIASKVMVVGFVRMIHRGGKPEFICLGRISAPASHISGRRPERYVEYVVPVPVRPADWTTDPPTREIRRVCRDYLSKADGIALSYPLEQALKILIDLCDNEDSARALDKFMEQRV
jgi:hypothetical protein